MNRDKEEMLLIGKSKLPLCLKNVKYFCIFYDFSTNAWMASTIFDKWLTSWDCHLQMERRKIVLLVDDCLVYYSAAS